MITRESTRRVSEQRQFRDGVHSAQVVSRTRLVDLPDDQSFTVDDFVHNQHDHIEVEVDVLTGKNLEIEAAVDDLVRTATDPAVLCRMYEGWAPWV